MIDICIDTQTRTGVNETRGAGSFLGLERRLYYETFLTLSVWDKGIPPCTAGLLTT